MTLKYLDHVNIRTARLEALKGFYRDLLGLEEGGRPDFGVGGAWLYIGERPVVHLVEVAETPDAPTPRVEHFAFMAEGLPAFRETLRRAGVDFRENVVPGYGWTQLFIRDPDGNNVEVTFTETAS